MSRSVGIAIDVGTSVVKVAALDEAGRIVAQHGAPAPVLRPTPGHSEYDTADVWGAVCTAVREVVNGLGARVDRISATGQGDGCWLIDAEGRAVGNAMLWNDGRSGSIVRTWQESGVDAKCFQINGSASFPGSQAALLSWVQKNDSDRIEASSTALFCTGWLVHRLTGDAVTDVSDASLPWLDVRRERWSSTIPAMLGLEWSTSLRPRLLDRDEPAGRLLTDAAHDLGIEAGIPVTHGPFDCVAMAAGADVLRPGELLVILGTTLIVEGVSDHVDTSGCPSGMTLCANVERSWLRLFGTLSGTDSLNWAAQNYGLGSAVDYFAAAQQSPPGSNGLHVLPYFSPAGERAPFINANARASLAGLSLDHDIGDIARAHVEGLTYSLRHCIDQLPSRPQSLVVCGGGAASEWWCQLIADVIGITVEAIGGVELGALGADVAARAQRDGVPLAVSAEQSRPSRSIFVPEATAFAVYETGYGRFSWLRDHAVESWDRLASDQPS